nr:hypothetical protein [Tanacetum cinerariifolium]GEY02735.1 hypothetical protein [Tanacetum cinerariifolium]
MSFASTVVTYTSVYTDSEPERVFWGAEEELSDDSPPRVIMYGYYGLPMQPVAPPSLDYIPGLEEPHDLDYVPEPIYPEYIPLEDEHVFLVEEQPLPPVDSPTAESPRYVAESDPEKDPEEYEDDETEDGPVDYPMDRGDDGDDDDGDSSGDDADDEDEDEEDEEEEREHLALADFAIVIPTVELVSPPKGTEHVIPPPSTDTTTSGARITVRLQASIPLHQRQRGQEVAFCLGLRFALEALRFVFRRSCVLSLEDLAFCLQKILRFVFKDFAFCLGSAAFCLQRSCVLPQKHCVLSTSKILHFVLETLRFVFKDCVLSQKNCVLSLRSCVLSR